MDLAAAVWNGQNKRIHFILCDQLNRERERETEREREREIERETK